MEIAITKRIDLKTKPLASELGFGQYFTDHMFTMQYNSELGWHEPEIVPHGPIQLDPAAMVLHYGQTVFEGLKAFPTLNGEINLFRAELNVARLKRSSERLCIPTLDEQLVLNAIKQLLTIDKDWMPTAKGTSIYIRPFVFATEACVGVRIAKEYTFMILLSPVGSYFNQGFTPIKIWVEEDAVRAVKGGMGEAKTAANYAASLAAQHEAKKKGCAQVLWLDGIHREYIEEVGAMNIFFRMKDRIVTPALNGSILDGVTRKSIIQILQEWGYEVEERRVSVHEIIHAQQDEALQEIFGTGTAAAIAPVNEFVYQNVTYSVGDKRIGELSNRLFNELTNLQTGLIKDTRKWITSIV